MSEPSEPEVAEISEEKKEWMEREEFYKNKLHEASKTIGELIDKIQMLQELKVGNNPIPEIEQELAELKVKSIHMEKVNTALEKENSVLKDDMSKKEKVDTTKSKLIELLDRKIDQLETRLKKAVATNEELARNVGVKNDVSKEKVKIAIESGDAFDAMKVKYEASEKDLIETKEALSQTQHKCILLAKANKELQAMLGDIENKGSKIATLAKEKLRSYSDRNQKLQDTIDKLTDDLQKLKELQKSGLKADAQEMVKGLEQKITMLDAKLNVKEKQQQLTEKHNDVIRLTVKELMLKLEKGDADGVKTGLAALAAAVDDGRDDAAAACNLVTKKTEELKQNAQKMNETLTEIKDAKVEVEEQLQTRDNAVQRIQDEINDIKGEVDALIPDSKTADPPGEDSKKDGDQNMDSLD